MIASGSDDRTIKVWKYTDEVAWEELTLTGHNHNVSCVVFDRVNPSQLVSVSEDRCLNVWNFELNALI